MDFTTLIGIPIAGSLVVASILMGGPGSWFIDAPSLMIVLGGTMGATLLAYPLREVLGVFGVVRNVFLYRSQSAPGLIPLLSGFARKARQEGILSFESEIQKLDDPFLARGLQMAIDGMEAGSIEEVLSTEILYVSERHRLGAEIFTTMGSFAPAVGMLGTIIGLIQAFTAVAEANPAEKADLLSASISVAMNTTAFGLIVAIPLLFVHTVLQSKTTRIIDSLEMVSVKFLNAVDERRRQQPAA